MLQLYNRPMTAIMVIMAIFGTLFVLPSNFTLAQDSNPLQSQMDACAKNTAMEWNNELNRCVGKRQARQERHDAQDCNKLESVDARKACHMNLATTKTGVTANAEEAASKVTSGQGRSAIINGANAIVGAINMIAKESSASSCMSKSIFGITAMGGFVTDLWMKIQTKKKLKALQNKYQIDNKTNPYDAQVKALVYLKEEQETVKKIAAQEKKRQMLLMIGYGAAAAVAAYETFSNSECYKPEKKPTTVEQQPATAQTSAPAPAATNTADGGTVTATATDVGDGGAETFPVSSPESPEMKPLDSPAPAGVAADVTTGNVTSGPKPMTVTSHVNGSTVHNSMTDGTKTYAIHNGHVYNSKPGVNGIPMAVGKPISKFDYNTGSWSGGKATEFAVTSNYSYSGGKISSGSGMAPTKDISFGTGGKK